MKKPKEVRTAFSIYAIKDCIGEGGCGLVYSATEENDDVVAIKILDPSKVTREKLKRFENEYRFCSNNKHPNIITVLNYGLTEDDNPFFVMPLYEASLRKLVGKLEPKEAYEIFKKILDGVEAAHKLGVIHRDLKPENILVNNNGNILVVADFGIASFKEEELYTAVDTKDDSRLANFQYAAPEQRSRGKDVTKKADIYSLGLILNELFTSEIAHGTNYKTIESISSDYPFLDILVDKMLQQEPSSRYENIEEIKKELIARGDEHISRQKLNRLKDTVIRSTEVDDPLIDDPMKIVDVDWSDNMLTIKLNHPFNNNWHTALLAMRNFRSVMYKTPGNFKFDGNEACISAKANDVQQIVDIFKEWLPRVNMGYAERIKKFKQAEELIERKKLESRIHKEEERTNVLRNVKF
jgi:serine/threonine protein kinase